MHKAVNYLPVSESNQMNIVSTRFHPTFRGCVENIDPFILFSL